MFTNTYAVLGEFSGKGVLTKGLDADNTITFAHNLPAIPDHVHVQALTGTEYGWMVTWDATNITVTCSALAGTAASTASIFAQYVHSIAR